MEVRVFSWEVMSYFRVRRSSGGLWMSLLMPFLPPFPPRDDKRSSVS